MTYQEIADRLGYRQPAGAWRAVQAGLQATLQAPADELRTLELERIETLWQGRWPRAIAGDNAAIVSPCG